jgi:hypothetical protein
MPPKHILARILWTAVIFLAFVGVAVATRRVAVLLAPAAINPANNPTAALDAHFADRRPLTLIHILPGILFMVLGPMQFIRGLRVRHPRVHRWSGRIFLTASAILGLAGLTMGVGPTVGGVDEKTAILLFGTLFLIFLGKAFWHALRREFAQHREWMIRGFAVGLAVAAIRPLMGAFFAAAVIHKRTPDPGSFFGAAFWIGFTVSAAAAELWIRYTRLSMSARPEASVAK